MLYHVINSPGPMEQLTILSIHVGFVQVIKSPSPWNNRMSIRVSCRVFTTCKIPRSLGRSNNVFIGISYRVFLQVVKSPGPLEQLTIFPLGFYLAFI